MNRREVLVALASTGTVGLAGCSRVTCAVEDDYDRLKMATVADDVANSPESIVITYSELSADAQQAVREAATDGTYRVCHEFDDATSGIEALSDDTSRQWNEADDGETPEGERTYLEYDGAYYGMEIDILDAEVMDSIPDQ